MSLYEPENQTVCKVSGDVHDWEWDEDLDDYVCVLCDVQNEYQEDI